MRAIHVSVHVAPVCGAILSCGDHGNCAYFKVLHDNNNNLLMLTVPDQGERDSNQERLRPPAELVRVLPGPGKVSSTPRPCLSV